MNILLIMVLTSQTVFSQSGWSYSSEGAMNQKKIDFVNFSFPNYIFPSILVDIDSFEKQYYPKNEYGKISKTVNDCVLFYPMDRFKTDDNLESVIFNRPILPYSIRFFLDSTDVFSVPNQTFLGLADNFDVPILKMLKPFYFRKYEVTNAEYRKFVSFVKDSIARVILSRAGKTEYGKIIASTDENGEKSEKLVLDYKKPVDWSSEELDRLNYRPEERYYGIKSLNPENWKYSFSPDGGEPVTINVYPDTMCWRNDFQTVYNEPISATYFWHKAYDEYPVVGISWYQALAYLDWRTKQHQKELNAKGINLKVHYDLPSEYEWDIAATTILRNGKPEYFGEYVPHLTDHSWVTDLHLLPDTSPALKMERIEDTTTINPFRGNVYEKDTTKNKEEADINYGIYQKSERSNKPVYYFRNDELISLLKEQFVYPGHFLIDGSGYTSEVKIGKQGNIWPDDDNKALNKDERGICFTGGNVSEWLKDSYSQWKPLFEKRQKQLGTFTGADIKILSQIERYFDEKNDANGKLVRGSNWFDERFSYKLGRNAEGTNAKAFIDPARKHATLGFRYVIRFEKK